MLMSSWKEIRRIALAVSRSSLVCLPLVAGLVLGTSQPVETRPLHTAFAIPAFARKYGLPCSACHEAWPKLNAFGQMFRDNGYQLGNDRDSPIYQNPAYWPITMRMTPQWHRESTSNQPVDSIPGDGTSTLVNGTVLQHGFDLSGIDIWTAGTLYKNISFSLLPSADSTGQFHFENAWVRFDNLFNNSWMNLKFGKFELDNLVSEKRFLFLSANGGIYQTYHFIPVGDSNDFGLGDNQLGIEFAGHSINSYTRYSVSLLSSNDGNVGLPSNRGYDTYLTFSQAFQAGSLGLQRIGVFTYIGQRPTYFQSTGGSPIPGAGLGNKPFYRAGVSGDFNLGKFNFMPLFMHGYDNVYLGTSTPANQPLPTGARAPTWNGGFLETHYIVNPQLVLIGRYELIRMAQQALPSTPGNTGNIDAYSIGYRWYPIMFSRAGLAFHNEYSIVKTVGAPPLSGDGTGLPPINPNDNIWSSSLLIGFDFDF